MTFDDPQENEQDETTTLLPRFGRLGYSGVNDPDQLNDDPGGGQRLSIGQRIVQMAPQGMSQPQPMLREAPELTLDPNGGDRPVRRVFPARANGAGENAAGLSIGQRIMGLSPKDVMPSQQSGLAPIPETPASKSRFEQQKQNIFGAFSPAGADSSLNSSSSGYQQSNPLHGAPSEARPSDRDNSRSDSGPIVDMRDQLKMPSRIPKQSSVVAPKPPNIKPDPTQLGRTLSQMMTGLRGPAMTPMGVAPDGTPMLDITSQVKAPSKIFPEKNRGFVYGDKVKPEFLTKLKGVSDGLGIDPNWLMTAIDFETGGKWAPDTSNAMGSGATGLIQFMPEIAKGLGTSTEELGKMSQKDQLDYVEKYLQPHKGQMHSLADTYMAILHPADLGKPDDYVLFKAPSKAYRQNSRAFDPGGKGYVTKADVVRALDNRYREGLARGTTVVNPDGTVSRVGGKHAMQPPKPPKVQADKKQLQRTLSDLMTGLRGSAMIPMGVAPDGSPMLDITSQIKAPSKIFPEKNREGSKSPKGLKPRPASSQK